MLWEMMDGSFCFGGYVCFGSSPRLLHQPVLFFFVNLLCVFAWKECVLLLQKGMMGILGPGRYHAVGFPVQCLVFVLYCVESFLESEKRHGIGVFKVAVLLSCHLTHMFLL